MSTRRSVDEMRPGRLGRNEFSADMEAIRIQEAGKNDGGAGAREARGEE
jgi:hypothetical protein